MDLGGLRLVSGLTLGLLTGCTVEEWRNADLQLDILDADLRDSDKVRICVDGVEIREEAVGNGLIGVPGLPKDQEHEVTVDALHSEDENRRTGRGGPISLSTSSPHAEIVWLPCGDDETCEPCKSGGEQAETMEDDWLLAIRLQ